MLVYPDVRQAVDWLSDASGFAERVRIGDDPSGAMAFVRLKLH